MVLTYVALYHPILCYFLLYQGRTEPAMAKTGRGRAIFSLYTVYPLSRSCCVVLLSRSPPRLITDNLCFLQTCCECCLLGKAAQEHNLPCDHSLALGYQCGLVSRACCVDAASLNDTMGGTRKSPAVSTSFYIYIIIILFLKIKILCSVFLKNVRPLKIKV